RRRQFENPDGSRPAGDGVRRRTRFAARLQLRANRRRPAANPADGLPHPRRRRETRGPVNRTLPRGACRRRFGRGSVANVANAVQSRRCRAARLLYPQSTIALTNVAFAAHRAVALASLPAVEPLEGGLAADESSARFPVGGARFTRLAALSGGERAGRRSRSPPCRGR